MLLSQASEPCATMASPPEPQETLSAPRISLPPTACCARPQPCAEPPSGVALHADQPLMCVAHVTPRLLAAAVVWGANQAEPRGPQNLRARGAGGVKPA